MARIAGRVGIGTTLSRMVVASALANELEAVVPCIWIPIVGSHHGISLPIRHRHIFWNQRFPRPNQNPAKACIGVPEATEVPHSVLQRRVIPAKFLARYDEVHHALAADTPERGVLGRRHQC